MQLVVLAFGGGGCRMEGYKIIIVYVNYMLIRMYSESEQYNLLYDILICISQCLHDHCTIMHMCENVIMYSR